jgi:tripartite-type tricarboxylate transporter receptor subunit TctC
MTGILTRRGALLGSLLAATPALAQTWPSRPIRYVVPFAAGAGVLDIMARIVAQKLSEKIDQQVVVDNKPGAGGNVGAEIVAKAAPDGYTMLMANTALTVAPYLYAKMTFDPLVDLVPVTMVNSAPLMLVVHPSLPVRSVTEFLFYAKAHPGKLNLRLGWRRHHALPGDRALEVDDRHRRRARALQGRRAGAGRPRGRPARLHDRERARHPAVVKDGKLRALAITSRKRSPLVPELPTMEEAGVPGYEMVGWNGVFLPKGTSERDRDKLHGRTPRVLRTKPVQEQMAALAPRRSAIDSDIRRFVKSESVRWGISAEGIKPRNREIHFRRSA